MIARRIRRSLAARSTAAILGMVSLGALAALLAGGYLASQYLENQQERFIEGLLLTVDNPPQGASVFFPVRIRREASRGRREKSCWPTKASGITRAITRLQWNYVMVPRPAWLSVRAVFSTSIGFSATFRFTVPS